MKTLKLKFKSTLKNKSKPKVILNNEAKLKQLISPNAGNFWIQFGWVSFKHVPLYNGKVYLTPKSRIFLYIFQLLNSSTCLYFGPHNITSIRYNYDVWALFGNKGIWFYIHLIKLLGSLVYIMIPYFFKPDYSSNINFIFECLKGQKPLLHLNLTDEKILHRFMLITHFIFKHYTHIALVIIAPLSYMVIVYVKHFFSIISFFLVIPLTIINLLIPMFFAYTIFAIPLSTFAIVVLYGKFRIDCFNLKIKKLIFRKVYSNRVAKIHLNKQVSSLIMQEAKFLSLILQINKFYSKLLPFLLSITIGYLVIVIVPIRKASRADESIIFGIILLFSLVYLVLYFTISAAFNRSVKRLYKLQAKLICYPLIIRIRWHLLLSQEYLASKRGKVGFHCYHWFQLSHMALTRVRI